MSDVRLSAATSIAPKAGAGAASHPVQAAKLRRASRDFEALLLKGLLQMASDPWKDGGGTPESDPAANTLKEIGLQAVAEAMAASGGMGLGRVVVRHLERSGFSPSS